MARRTRRRLATVIAAAAGALVALASATSALAQGASVLDLERAVIRLRLLKPGELSEAEEKRRAAQLEAASAAVLAAGKEGIARLKRELEAADNAKEYNHFFRLHAAALLWKAGRFEHVESITRIWSAVPIDAHYDCVFHTAFDAALTQDPRALPLLRVCLADDKGTVRLPKRWLTLRWPRTLEVLWGAFGPKGLPALERILDRSRDPVELKSAMRILTQAGHLRARGRIRSLARSPDPGVRHAAIRCLGLYGHPDDFLFLYDGLREPSPEDAAHYVLALEEYGDLRAVPRLVPLLKLKDPQVRRQVITTLTRLLTPEALEALHTHARKARVPAESRACWKAVGEVLAAIQLTWSDYADKTPQEQAPLLAAVRRKAEAKFALAKDDRPLSRADFLKATAQWKGAHRIRAGEYAWVEDRHVLAAATPQDIARLLEVRAALYAGLTSDSLAEVRTVERWVQRLGRRRYRAAVGVCDRADPRR